MTPPPIRLKNLIQDTIYGFIDTRMIYFVFTQYIKFLNQKLFFLEPVMLAVPNSACISVLEGFT